MSTAMIVQQARKLASLFDIPDTGELVSVLKATAFKGPVTDAQMSALLIVAKHVAISADGCWEWQGSLSRGYGQLTHQGKHQTAHRFSYQQFVGPVADGMWVLHTCDNRKCVNPLHLYQGDAVDNRADMLDRNRWSHPWGKRNECTKGHEYAVHGFRIARDGSRVCMTCQRENKRAYRAAKQGVSA